MQGENKSPKILIFTMTSWNSKVGANTWETLVKDFDRENLANVYLREEIPDSEICSRYFCISENRVIKSILKRKTKTGREVESQPISNSDESEDLLAHRKRYEKMKKHRRYSMVIAREILWKVGKWKSKELDKFLDEFKPDIILHGMDGYIHLNRIVRYAIKRTGAKAIGYIWDDNFTYKQSRKFGHNFYRFFQRKSLKKLAKKTDGFFAITPKTKKEADEFFGIDCTVLTKPLYVVPTAENYEGAVYPLKMLYTGNLFIGRDNALKSLSKALVKVNSDNPFVKLDVYTQTVLSKEYLAEVENDYLKVYPPISQKEVLQVQKEADVLLLLEDLSKKNNVARLSFSTKITDYYSAGKCIFALGNPDLAPLKYLEETNSAIVVCDEEKISAALLRLKDVSVLNNFAVNSVSCGIANHNVEKIKTNFKLMIEKVYSDENSTN